MKKQGKTNSTYLECLDFSPIISTVFLMSVAQSVYILKNPLRQPYLSPDRLKMIEGTKDLYIFLYRVFS